MAVKIYVNSVLYVTFVFIITIHYTQFYVGFNSVGVFMLTTNNRGGGGDIRKGFRTNKETSTQ